MVRHGIFECRRVDWTMSRNMNLYKGLAIIAPGSGQGSRSDFRKPAAETTAADPVSRPRPPYGRNHDEHAWVVRNAG